MPVSPFELVGSGGAPVVYISVDIACVPLCTLTINISGTAAVSVLITYNVSNGLVSVRNKNKNNSLA
jgi:hypothetical protein